MQEGKIAKLKEFSKFPPCTKDISFWKTNDFHSNDLFEIVREIAGDIVEKVACALLTYYSPMTFAKGAANR